MHGWQGGSPAMSQQPACLFKTSEYCSRSEDSPSHPPASAAHIHPHRPRRVGHSRSASSLAPSRPPSRPTAPLRIAPSPRSLPSVRRSLPPLARSPPPTPSRRTAPPPLSVHPSLPARAQRRRTPTLASARRVHAHAGGGPCGVGCRLGHDWVVRQGVRHPTATGRASTRDVYAAVEDAHRAAERRRRKRRQLLGGVRQRVVPAAVGSSPGADVVKSRRRCGSGTVPAQMWQR